MVCFQRRLVGNGGEYMYEEDNCLFPKTVWGSGGEDGIPGLLPVDSSYQDYLWLAYIHLLAILHVYGILASFPDHVLGTRLVAPGISTCRDYQLDDFITGASAGW